MNSADELERAYREEATRIRAALAARVGDVGLAGEAVQDAFVEALEHWCAEGVPPNPGGWLATTARRKAAARSHAREPEVLGLLALLLHESRGATRFDGWGRLVRLRDQDRTRWDRALIAEATRLLARATTLDHPAPYQLQAAIAATHAAAPSYELTGWQQIRALYDRLHQFTPSPVVRLNRAVATRYAISPLAALAEVDPLAADLGGYRLLHAVRAELLADLGRREEARSANERALALAANPAERELLARRLSL